ncbi:MAG: class I SAM-dependent methyltransferase [Planctomycetota bacterium]
MDSRIRRITYHFPWIGKRLQAWTRAAEELSRLNPGHYYSPIADDATIERHARLDVGMDRRNSIDLSGLDGIDLCLDEQIDRARQWSEAGYFSESVFAKYDPCNSYFMNPDAVMLSAIISAHHPKRVIEVGSGHSTLALLDCLRARSLDGTKVDAIEPFPERLLSVIDKTDRQRFTLHARTLERSDVEMCRKLAVDDVLLVDSSHIYKVGSDVQLLFESILPTLAVGVLIHIHDVFFPFDYPASWLRRGHHYNEAYVLRAFLQYNRNFEIYMWNDLLRWIPESAVPTALKPDPSLIAGSLWLRRVA